MLTVPAAHLTMKAFLCVSVVNCFCCVYACQIKPELSLLFVRSYLYLYKSFNETLAHHLYWLLLLDIALCYIYIYPSFH